jgi:hypothetical protein
MKGNRNCLRRDASRFDEGDASHKEKNSVACYKSNKDENHGKVIGKTHYR